MAGTIRKLISATIAIPIGYVRLFNFELIKSKEDYFVERRGTLMAMKIHMGKK